MRGLWLREIGNLGTIMSILILYVGESWHCQQVHYGVTMMVSAMVPTTVKVYLASQVDHSA